MKRTSEEELDILIDSLNHEREPRQKLNYETSQLLAVVSAVKSIRPQAEPTKNLGQRIYHSITKSIRRPQLLLPTAALTAGLLVFIFLTTLWTGANDVVHAMNKAAANLANYHGMLEVRVKNQAGDDWLVQKAELWSEGDKYAVRQNDGTLTVNNNQRKWQVRPQSREVALLPLLPDPVGQGFDLKDEAKRAKQYPYSVVGEELISGHKTTKLRILPPGGQPYYLWVDRDTNLPLQLQTAMQNALQTTYSFTSFEPNIKVDPAIFTYQPPKGYKIIEKDPGQQVNTAEQASVISRFVPLLPQEAPKRIFAFHNRIVLDYGNTIIEQTPAKGALKPENYGALGKAAGGPVEVIHEQLRWIQDGVEILITGPKRIELARQIAKDLTLSDTGESLSARAQIKVPVDIEIAKADQQQVDGGHSPWQLDPLYVAFTFVNLKVSPEGIKGEGEIPESSLKTTANNGIEAIVKVNVGPVKHVYLKRIVRQNDTGIWSVIGYDPR